MTEQEKETLKKIPRDLFFMLLMYLAGRRDQELDSMES